MSALYAAAQVDFLTGSFDWATAALVVFLVDGTYTPNFATDTYVADITSGAQMSDQVALISVATTGGVLSAAGLTLTSVDTARIPQALVLAVSGDPASAKLLAYINDGLGFGAAAEAASVQLNWDTRGIFAP